MKTRFIVLTGLVALVAGLTWTTWKPAEVLVMEATPSAPTPSLPPLPDVAEQPPLPAAPEPAEVITAEPTEDSTPASSELAPITSEHVESFMSSAVEGDLRAPPIGTSTPRPEPTPEELARPDLYQGYEKAQEEKMHRAFIAAAREQEATLEEAIIKARVSGMAPEQIAEGEEKLARLRSVRTELEARYPDTQTPVTTTDPVTP